MTDVYGILGHPVGHSLSPIMHNRAFAALGIDAVYVPFSVTPDRLEQSVRGIQALELRGVNVTLPHKTAIMPLLDVVEPDASAIGAVNTVYRANHKLCGTNTDAGGLVRALREAGVELQGVTATVLGAGGAARAAVVGLARAGAKQITVCARRVEQAQALVHDLHSVSPATRFQSCDWAPLAQEKVFAATHLLIQATSATLESNPAAEDFARNLPLSALAHGAVAVDLAYRPRETTFLRAATQLGHKTLDGLGMLLHQGGLAFELWTGRSAPLEEMRSALLEQV